MKTKEFRKFSLDALQDPAIAADYLSIALEGGVMEEFLLALRNVAEAHGGIGTISDITELNRQSLYKMLSDEGNPTLSSLLSIASALGLSLKFTVDEKEAA